MSTIILARHGRLAWDFRTPIPGHALAAWLEGERDAPLATSSRPSTDLERMSAVAACLIASPLRRSLESARRLAPSIEPTIIEDVREAALPYAFRSAVRLPPMLWAGLARAAWFCGWSAGVESFSAARQRAGRAARRLHALAQQGDVVVIGHGLMNALIAAPLRALGWHGPWFPSRSHWGFGRYSIARQVTQLAE